MVLTSWALSSNASAIASWSAGGITSLDSVMSTKLTDSAASRMPPPIANPNDNPNDWPAELTPAASLTRSSSIGPRM